jgi:cysteinyl-tRNA synthetase
VPTSDISASAADIAEPAALRLIEDFEIAMDNDFNSPEALVVLEKARAAIIAELDKLPAGTPPPQPLRERVYVLRQLGAVLGLFFDSLDAIETEGLRIVAGALGAPPLTPASVRAIVQERAEARATKDFARSDELRRQLNAHGVDVLDTKAGSSWRFA